MDTEKYDRQIRLFGLETQQALAGMAVQIIGSSTLISAEIAKNVTLLGIAKLITTDSILAATERMISGSLRDINERMTIDISDDAVPCDFLFAVDAAPSSVSGWYFICSKCLTIQRDISAHDCPEASPDTAAHDAMECLAGALAVQEFIKVVQGKEHVISYRVRL